MKGVITCHNIKVVSFLRFFQNLEHKLSTKIGKKRMYKVMTVVTSCDRR